MKSNYELLQEWKKQLKPLTLQELAQIGKERIRQRLQLNQEKRKKEWENDNI
jgi:hypothetical protein